MAARLTEENGPEETPARPRRRGVDTLLTLALAAVWLGVLNEYLGRAGWSYSPAMASRALSSLEKQMLREHKPHRVARDGNAVPSPAAAWSAPPGNRNERRRSAARGNAELRRGNAELRRVHFGAVFTAPDLDDTGR